MSLSLYIHTPWCIRKCPYCDFNSHKAPDILPEQAYIQALLADFKEDIQRFPNTTINTLFIGGGTPSLLSADAYDILFQGLKQHIDFAHDIEITLEANPGTVDQERFTAYRALGINRLSLGIQSFDATHLKALGRIHDDQQAHRAIHSAREAGFDNINLDIMHGLPNQTIAESLNDLKLAISHEPEHLSWYELTIEPNTEFYKYRPTLPAEDTAYAMEEEGFALLDHHHFKRYEISAFCRNNQISQHNLNYWRFGDYYGIGAGAHGKLSSTDHKHISRTRKHRQPKDYLDPNKAFIAEITPVSTDALRFEFMLNTTRLEEAIPLTLFTQKTGLPLRDLKPKLIQAETMGLITLTNSHWQVTPFGRKYTNNLQEMFL